MLFGVHGDGITEFLLFFGFKIVDRFSLCLMFVEVWDVILRSYTFGRHRHVLHENYSTQNI